MAEPVADLLVRLEDAISNIDEVGTDASYWESQAITLARELAARVTDPTNGGQP